MTGEMLFVLAVLAAAIVLFVTDRVRSDVVALLVMLALMLSGVLSVREALAGFGDPVVLLIAGLFVVGEALVTTGLAQRIGGAVLKAGKGSETRLIALLMLAAGTVGGFMSSTAIVAIFIPVAQTIAKRTGLNRKRLLMPLSVAALISGMMTLIATSPNLVVDEALKERNLPSLGFFTFTPFGIAVLAVGITFMLLFGRRMLAKEQRVPAAAGERTIDDLIASYGLSDRYRRFAIPPGSPLDGRTVARAQLRQRYGVILIGFDKGRAGHHFFIPATPETVFEQGDSIVVIGEDDRLLQIEKTFRLVVAPPLPPSARSEALQTIGAAEIMLAPESRLVGRTLGEVEFRSRYGLSVVAIRRRGQAVTADLVDYRLDFGDALLVAGSWDDLLRLREERNDFVLMSLPEEAKNVAPARRRAPVAVAILAAMVAAMASGLVPTVAAVLIAAIAMVAFGCVPVPAAYRTISWAPVVLVAGILPLATALAKTGITHIVSAHLVATLAPLGPYAMLAVIYLVTAGLGLFISNTATAVLIAPIAIDAALELGVSPQAFAMTVAIACSAAYVTPVSSPVNTLVLDPGGYGFMDFVKVGTPLLLLTMLVTIALAGALFPL